MKEKVNINPAVLPVERKRKMEECNGWVKEGRKKAEA